MFSLVFLGPRLNAEFPTRLYVAVLFLTKRPKYEHKMTPPPFSADKSRRKLAFQFKIPKSSPNTITVQLFSTPHSHRSHFPVIDHLIEPLCQKGEKYCLGIFRTVHYSVFLQ